MGKGWIDRVKSGWERVEDIAGGVAGVVDGSADIVIDLAQAPFTDDEFGGVWDTIKGVAGRSGGQILESSIGPEKGLGAFIGGLPTDTIRSPVKTALDGLETAYREGVSEPLSTLVTVASEASKPEDGFFGDWGEFFKRSTWRDAYRVAQDRGPGQAIAAALLTDDIDDEAKVDAAIKSPMGQVVSATFDGLIRYSLDPSVLAGAGVSAARRTYVSEAGLRGIALRSPDDIAAAATSHRVNGFIERVQAIKDEAADLPSAAAKVRDELFPNHAYGAPISTVLVEAGDLGTQRLTVRALMGERAALDELLSAEPAQAHMIRNLMSGDAEALAREAGEAVVDVDPHVLYESLDRIDRWDDAFASLTTVPDARRTSQLRSAVTRSDFYQRNPLTAPIRTVTNMRPQHWLDLNDQRSDIQIARVLQKANLPEGRQLALRGEYVRATSAATRQQAAIRIENEITRHVLEAKGVSREAVDQIILESNRLRDGALGALRRRVYDAKGRGVVEHVDVDGTIERIALPLHVTQQADLLPLVDVESLERAATAASRMGWTRFRLENPLTDLPAEGLEMFYRVWRPATLLRVGWPLRILGDEQLRILASIGGMTGYGRTGLTEIADRASSAVGRRIPGVRNAERVAREAVDERAVGRYAGGTVQGVAVPGPFDGAGGRVAMQRNSSAGTFRDIAQSGEESVLRELRQHTGQWRVSTPVESDHLSVWADVLNKQVKQSAFARVFLSGGSVDDGVAWLNTVEGLAYARQMGWSADNFASHADDVFDQVSRYAPPGVREELLERDLNAADLVRLSPNIDLRPAVHGEELAQALGDSALKRAARNIVASAWENLGRVPTDALSRNPFFAFMYEQETSRLVGLLGPDDLTPEMVEQIARSARKKALNASQQVLYDLAEKSEFAHMLRFISPFYMAWQEVITRWATLGAANPVFAARARLAWNAPEKAGLVRDEHGYRIDENGVPHDPFTDAPLSKELAGSDRYVQLPFAIPGLPTRGPIKFNKKGFNLALTGSPGVGPAVQVPVNEIVKDRPDLASVVEFILPYGSTQETWSLMLPATARRAFSLAQGDENRLYTNDLGRIYTTKMTDYLLGKRDTVPTYEEVQRDTDRLYMLRTAISWLSPVAPSFNSPYQAYIDAYRNAQALLRDDDHALGTNDDGTPVSVDEWFLDTYGEEFFYLTTTFTRAKDGVPPTLEGWEARDKYKDLIEAHPDLGGLIIGSEGAGEFARGVYDAQLSTPVRPGSATMQRESLGFEDFVRDPEIRLGWIKYSRYMDMLDAELHRRGLPNFQVAAASDLAGTKRQIITQLGEKYPEWFEEFNQQDRLAFTRRLEGMRTIAADERFEDRPDIQGLGLYLKYRDLVLTELGNREASTLTASSNQDLAYTWESIKVQIVEQNPAFAPVFYRFLENDPMEVN